MRISAAFGGQALTDDFIPDQSGTLYSGQLTGSHVLSLSSLFQLQLCVSCQDAQIGAYSYSGIWFGGGYSRDLPFGFSAGFQPSYFITRYDDARAGFGKTRADNALMLAFTLLNRHFGYHGITPRLSNIFSKQHSNIPLYSFTQNQSQIGATSLF